MGDMAGERRPPSRRPYSRALTHVTAEHDESRKLKERSSDKIQRAKSSKAKDRQWIGYSLIFLCYIVIVVGTLSVAQMNLNKHTRQSQDLYKVVLLISDCNYHITNSLMGFMELKTAATTLQSNLMNKTEYDRLSKSFFVDDFYTEKKNVLGGDYLELGEKTIAIADILSSSAHLWDIDFSRGAFEHIATFDQKILVNSLSESATKAGILERRMNLVQSLSTYWSVLAIEKDLNPTETSAILEESRVFMVREGYDKLVETNMLIIENGRLILKQLYEEYHSVFVISLLVVSGLIFCVLVAWLVQMYFHRRMLADILHTYSILNSDSLRNELERTLNLQCLAEAKKYDSKVSMQLARRTLSHHMPAELDQIYFSQVGIVEYKELALLMKDQTHKEFGGERSSHLVQSSRFNHGRLLSLFWYIFAMVCLLIVSWGVEAVILVQVNVIVKKADTIQELGMLNTEYGMRLQRDFARYYRFSPYILNYFSIPDLKNAVKDLRYRKTQQEYLRWWSDWQGQLRESLGEENIFELFQEADICLLTQKGTSAHLHQNNWSAKASASCATALRGIVTKGFFQYVMYESNMAESIQLSLESVFADGIKAGSKIEVQRSLLQVWMLQEYVDLRVWHELIFSRILDVTSTRNEADLEQRVADAQASVKSLLLIGICLVILPLLFFILFIVPLINLNYEISLHTFEVISPHAIMSGQLSLNKFKKCFNLLNK